MLVADVNIMGLALVEVDIQTYLHTLTHIHLCILCMRLRPWREFGGKNSFLTITDFDGDVIKWDAIPWKPRCNTHIYRLYLNTLILLYKSVFRGIMISVMKQFKIKENINIIISMYNMRENKTSHKLHAIVLPSLYETYLRTRIVNM